MDKIIVGLALGLVYSATALSQPSDREATEIDTTLDPASIVVLPIEALSVDPAFENIATAVYEYLNSKLAESGDWSVIDADSVEAFATSALEPREWAAQLGAGKMLEGGVRPHRNGYALRYAFSRVSTGTQYVSGYAYSREPWDPETGLSPVFTKQLDEFVAISADMAANKLARAKQYFDDKQVARVALLDQSLSIEQRVEALSSMRPPFMAGTHPMEYADGGESLSGEVALAAVELAQSSDDPQVRTQVWGVMRGVRDSSLTAPLLSALANDPDATVRRVAAIALQFHVADPAVVDALTDAHQSDTDAAVREAAFLSSATNGESIDYLRERILNKSLSMQDRRVAMFQLYRIDDAEPFQADPDLLTGMAEWARSVEDDTLRREIWVYLGGFGKASAAPILIDAFLSETDETVREYIVSSLLDFTGEPGVRAVIDTAAVDDESPLVRKAATRFLDSLP
ncbi:MAG: HEAT repeat domain-containing protein [Pseudomonadota bacterium]